MMDAGEGPVFRILLVEDNLGDARLVEEVLKEGAFKHKVSHVRDGVEAINFLRRTPGYENAERPHIIFLDLNMPRMDGREVLAEMKRDPNLGSIPVVVLTTSTSEEDIIRSYSLNANCYVTKPVSIDAFLDVMRTIEAFWFDIARMPPEPGRAT